MYIEKFQNVNGSTIAVTGTATNIFDLINTAQATTLTNAGFSSGVNAITIQPAGGDIRVTFDGTTPTATAGFLIKGNSTVYLPNIPLKALKLIRTGGSNVSCSILVGKSDMGESMSVSTPQSGPQTVIRAAANLPQTAQTPYFTVTGGRCRIKIYGEVTTIVENTGAVNIDLWSNPANGTADAALCAVVNAANAAVGSSINITGTPANAAIINPSSTVLDQADWVVVPAGTIDLKTSASKTGATKWVVQYEPIDVGASIAAA